MFLKNENGTGEMLGVSRKRAAAMGRLELGR